MRAKDVKKEIAKITEVINELSARLLVVASIQQGDGKYSELVLRAFKKRINLLLPRSKSMEHYELKFIIVGIAGLLT